ncbi:MAG: CRISPR-associated helicase Cas3', partial [Dehalococcoidia bacterium]
ACITTIDQYLAAFAGAPLSSFTDTTTGWSLGRAKVGHAVAGAVLTSYSVFDEVHLLDSKYGLQLLIAVLNQRRRWGLLSTVSTATLPDSVVQYLTKDQDGPQLQLVTASEADIKQRDDYREVALSLANDFKEGTPTEGVVKQVREGLNEHGKVILFANTVDRALRYYEALKSGLGSSVRVLLVHSRFASNDRQEKEQRIREWFGKDSQVRDVVLVTTQVAEAGLNISAPLVLTELCPADSLVQRAGRCARFGGKGQTVVFKPAHKNEARGQDEPNYWAPYPQAVVKKTEEVIPSFTGVLDWPREQKLVNKALGELYGAWVRGEANSEELDQKGQPQRRRPSRLRPTDALGPFERAFRSHSPYELEQWLRNPEGRPLSVQVAIAASLDEARAHLAARRHPEMVTVPFGVFRQRMQGKQVPEMDVAKARAGEDGLILTSQVAPGRTYLLLKDEAGYSAEKGLTLDGTGEALDWKDSDKAQRNEEVDEDQRHQTLQEHTLGTLRQASRLVDLYMPFLEAWATAVFGDQGDPKEIADALADAMKAAVAFHDVGKLGKEWQGAAGWEAGRPPVARFPERTRKPPPHAAFAYPFLQALFRQAHGQDAFLRPLEFIALAAARHHSLTVSGAIRPGDFVPFDYDEALAALREVAGESGLGMEDDWIEEAFTRIADKDAWKEEPYYADEAPSPSDDFYPIYCIAQRLVKLADWEDAGQRDIELMSQETADEEA